jgi:short-subunit dehydrogenase
MTETGKLALVTGASSGIGLELAKLLAEDGYDLVIAADGPGIHVAATQLAANGTKVHPVQVDLRKPRDVERLYQHVSKQSQPLTVAALNAGTGRAGPFVEGALQDDLDIVDLNVRSTVHLAKLVLGGMVIEGTGAVLFTSSIVAMMPGSNQSMYNASKSFIQSFAEALHDELRDTDITVTALVPGPTDTNFFRRTGMLDTLLGRMPMKDDPAKVAQQGLDALIRGRRKVVAESATTKLIGLASRVLPDSVKATANHIIATPHPRR